MDEDFSFLKDGPTGLEKLCISYNPLGGYGLVKYLPQSLKELEIFGTHLTVDLNDLPENLLITRNGKKITY